MVEGLSRADGFATLARRYGERVAVEDRAGTITYADLFARGAALGLALIAAGVRPGDPVAVFLRNGIPAVWASIGVTLSGAAEVSLNAALSEADRRHCLGLAAARYAVTTQGDAAFFAGLGLTVIPVETIGTAEAGGTTELDPARFPRVAPEAWARIGFTSGTTGAPKGIVTTQGARWAGNLLQRATLPHRPGPESRLLVMTPFSHGASLLTYAYLDLGGAVTLLDGVDAPFVLDLLARRAVDEMFAPPTVLAKIVAAAEGRELPGLKTIFCGTAVLSPGLYARAKRIFGPVVRVTYGKTEVINPITVLEAAETDAWYAEGGETADACVGWPATGVEVLVAGDDGRPVPGGEVGEVHLKGHQMLAGTIRAEGFAPQVGFHETGDLGYRDARGRLHLVGRAADVIKTGGYKVAPEEVERALAGGLGGAEVAALGLPSEYWGEVIVAAVEGAPPDFEARIAAAAAGMTGYKRPRLLVAVEALPRNAMGKLSRRTLREQILASHAFEDGPRPRLVPRDAP